MLSGEHGGFTMELLLLLLELPYGNRAAVT